MQNVYRYSIHLISVCFLYTTMISPANATPPVYNWHILHSTDPALAQTIDANGNIITAGIALSAWVGNNNENAVHGYTGQGNVWILKHDSTGNYLWHTFIGDSTTVSGSHYIDLATDSAGSIYLTGNVSQFDVWNGPNGELPLEPFHGGNIDGYISKINSAGQYQWHRFVGPDGSAAVESTHAVATDTAGNIYTSNANLRGAFFIDKFTPEGALTWRVPYGKAGLFGQGDIHVDNSNAVFATHYSPAENVFNFTNGEAPVHTLGSGSDLGINVIKLNSDGVYQWHTFHGGQVNAGTSGVSSKVQLALTTTSGGDVYVGGSANGSWQVDGVGPRQPFRGSSDIFVTKLDLNGAYKWHVFWGGSEPEAGASMVLDDEENVVVSSIVQSNWLGPDKEQPFAPLLNSFGGVMLAMNGDGVYLWHTFLNGTIDSLSGDSRSLYVAGTGRYETDTRFSEINLLGTDTRAPLSNTTPLEGVFVARYDYGNLNIDNVPDTFSFNPIAGLAPNTIALSETVPITGLSVATNISITGGAYSLDGGDYTNAPGSISNGQSVRLQVMSSDQFSTSREAVLTIGGVNATFTVTTRGENAPANDGTGDTPVVAVPTVPGGGSGGGRAGYLLLALLFFIISIRRYLPSSRHFRGKNASYESK